MNPLELGTDRFHPASQGTIQGKLARPGETVDSAGPKEKIWQALREVNDDQLYDVDSNIVDLGYVYVYRSFEAVLRESGFLSRSCEGNVM